MDISAQGCATIATVLPVLLLATLASNRWVSVASSLPRKRDKIVDVSAVIFVTVGTGLAVYGATTDKGLRGAPGLTAFYSVILILIITAFFIVARLFFGDHDISEAVKATPAASEPEVHTPEPTSDEARANSRKENRRKLRQLKSRKQSRTTRH